MSFVYCLIRSQILSMTSDRGDRNLKCIHINSYSISDGVSHVVGRPELLYFMSEMNSEL